MGGRAPRVGDESPRAGWTGLRQAPAGVWQPLLPPSRGLSPAQGMPDGCERQRPAPRLRHPGSGRLRQEAWLPLAARRKPSSNWRLLRRAREAAGRCLRGLSSAKIASRRLLISKDGDFGLHLIWKAAVSARRTSRPGTRGDVSGGLGGKWVLLQGRCYSVKLRPFFTLIKSETTGLCLALRKGRLSWVPRPSSSEKCIGSNL